MTKQTGTSVTNETLNTFRPNKSETGIEFVIYMTR